MNAKASYTQQENDALAVAMFNSCANWRRLCRHNGTTDSGFCCREAISADLKDAKWQGPSRVRRPQDLWASIDLSANAFSLALRLAGAGYRDDGILVFRLMMELAFRVDGEAAARHWGPEDLVAALEAMTPRERRVSE